MAKHVSKTRPMNTQVLKKGKWNDFSGHWCTDTQKVTPIPHKSSHNTVLTHWAKVRHPMCKAKQGIPNSVCPNQRMALRIIFVFSAFWCFCHTWKKVKLNEKVTKLQMSKLLPPPSHYPISLDVRALRALLCKQAHERTPWSSCYTNRGEVNTFQLASWNTEHTELEWELTGFTS